MKNKQKAAIMLIITLAIFSCSKGDHSHSKTESVHGMKTTPQTGDVKIIIVDDFQAAFELYDKAKHDQMAKDMLTKNMQYDKNASHYIILSLMKKPASELIKNATVEVEVAAPDKKSVKKKAHTMEGGGMFHYAAGFEMKAKGSYKVSALITIGTKKVTASTEFDVK